MALIARWHCFWSLCDTYDEGAAGGFDDIVRDYGHFVDLHNPLDLREQPVEEGEIAAGDPGDCRDRLYIGEICVVEIDTKRAPMPGQKGSE